MNKRGLGPLQADETDDSDTGHHTVQRPWAFRVRGANLSVVEPELGTDGARSYRSEQGSGPGDRWNAESLLY